VSEQRKIPQNIEAEQSVIGGVLLGARPPALSAGDFYRAGHGLIFEAMLSLEAKQEQVDLVTVKAELERADRLQKTGGASYLASLVDHTPSITNIERYTQIVKDKAILRRIISECEGIAEVAFEPGVGSQEVLDNFQTVALRIDGGGSTGSTVKELAKKELKQIEDAYQSKKHLLGISTGFRRLDNMTLGWQAPDLIVIAARPSQGKTALALDSAKAAADAGTKVYFASLEMSSEQLMMRLLSSECGISGRSLRLGRFPEGDWPRIIKASGRLAELDIIIDDTPAISEMELARRVRRLKPGLLVVDYLQLMCSAQRADRKDLEIANITAGLKGLAKELYIPIILLSQLNREVEKRKKLWPKLSDLRESGAIEQDCDLCLGIYQDPENLGVAELICLKHRNGPLGTVKMAFREALASFADLA
jgi:replicative DNA helicase